MLSADHPAAEQESIDAFWQWSSLDPVSAAAFGNRVVSYQPPPAGPHPLTPATAGRHLLPVRDRVQRLLASRRSRRSFDAEALPEKAAIRVLAATGADSRQRRLVPSAGGLGAVHTYAIGMAVNGPLGGRVVKYEPTTHAVHDLAAAPEPETLETLFQLECRGTPQLVVVFVIDPTEILRKYGPRGCRFALQEVGHAAQNVSLRAAADDLVAYVLGGGLDDEVLDLLNVGHTAALYGGAIAVGR